MVSSLAFHAKQQGELRVQGDAPRVSPNAVRFAGACVGRALVDVNGRARWEFGVGIRD